MTNPFPLSPGEWHGLRALAAGKDLDAECDPGVIESLRSKGLLDIVVQPLPMFPCRRRYALTPLGRYLLRGPAGAGR
ncbi:hypothetical protein [Marinobacterium aestuariivivens]|uniref:Uncharacterized protein n=1 Tax=Marinobacterium aestuariivivens TaxID=1698799 RepID=A0ABW2A6M8_9GAMM